MSKRERHIPTTIREVVWSCDGCGKELLPSERCACGVCARDLCPKCFGAEGPGNPRVAINVGYACPRCWALRGTYGEVVRAAYRECDRVSEQAMKARMDCEEKALAEWRERAKVVAS